MQDQSKDKSANAKLQEGNDKTDSMKDDKLTNTPKELSAITGENEETRKGDKDSKSGKLHGKKGGKKGGKSTNSPLFETGNEMEFQNINTKDPKKKIF